MSAKDAENTAPDPPGADKRDNNGNDAVAAVCAYVAALPEREGRDACIEEGRSIAAIVEPLGLPTEILAAVLVYPLYRDGLISP
ncbi:MAG: hypothetical protein OEZ11_17575, partial [Gammaproteobacteria bacterium]|nr:hypothetical protein [Gammaproteobacteria bacterium]